MKATLTIVGNDSSRGASIQADIKTMTAHGVYVMSAITALTAQNTTGVIGTMEITPSLLEEQLDSIFTDIFPDTAKIGMVSSGGLIEVTGDRLVFYRAANVVVDPAMVSTGGPRLTNSETIEALREVFPPMVNPLTPSIPGAEVLSGMGIHNPGSMETATRATGEDCGCTVPLKGGRQFNDANNLLYRDKKLEWFKGRRIDDPNAHGTGCILPSAITPNLAKGMDVNLAAEWAKAYLSGALEAQLDSGKGSRPMNRGLAIRGEH